MQKTIAIVLGFSVIVGAFLLASTAFAVKPAGPAAVNGLAHPGGRSQLELYEKDPGDWSIVEDGAWGRLSFGANGFVFNGHGLEAGWDYTLIDDAKWGQAVKCLDSGVANDGGNLHLSGGDEVDGPKVWLVLTADVDCGTGMTGWNPTEYLFEYNTI